MTNYWIIYKLINMWVNDELLDNLHIDKHVGVT